ncbi:molybdopterin-dependent oxidoreductase [Dehalobacter sp. DCM]|nr:molybdopterin-dependent oxidoreductase [Dehalobacter sp. DCM]
MSTYDELYRKEWQWQEGDLTVTRSMQWSGPGCHNGCGLLYYTKDNKIVKIEGDPNSPYNQGRLCMRCLNLTESLEHKDRLKWPLKRIGERGENKWQRISWNEALDIIEANVRKIQKEYGPESICGMVGTGRNICWQVPLLTYAGFGSPNFGYSFLSGDSCFSPRAAFIAVTHGDFSVCDCSQFHEDRYDNPEYKVPEVILIWGNNPIHSNSDDFLGHWIVELMKRGTRLIVVDPKLTWLAGRAEYWLQLRPGTDAALGLGMLNVIINENLYDQEFVEKWTYGFEELAERVRQYPVDKVAEITWVPKEQIEEAARFFAQAKPGAIQWGLKVDQSVAGVPAAQAIATIGAICGFIDIPGSNIYIRDAYDILSSYGTGYEEFLSPEMRAKRLGDEKYPLKRMGVGPTAHADSVLVALETGKPYPVKMLWIQTSNPIANMGADAPRLYKAIRTTDFNVVVDLYMTPTAVACADLVLPAGMSPERNGYKTWWHPLRSTSKIVQYYECKSDEQIVLEVGKRLAPQNFPWETDIDLINWMFSRSATYKEDFQTLQQKVTDYQKYEYKKYEKGLLRFDGETGFNTPTGKLELYSTLFAEWGLDPLPYFEEPPYSPVSTPLKSKEYPFILTTGARSLEFFHSEHRQLKTMREFHPDPLFDINSEIAAEMGIQEGDWCWLENHNGRCRQRAHLDPALSRKVIRAEHGWWFPEMEGSEPALFGVFDSNSNNLTEQCQNGPTGYGAPYANTICKVYKATEENSLDLPSLVVTRKGGF